MGARPSGRQLDKEQPRDAVHMVLSERPGVSAGEIAAVIGATESWVADVLRDLCESGKVQSFTLPSGRIGYRFRERQRGGIWSDAALAVNKRPAEARSARVESFLDIAAFLRRAGFLVEEPGAGRLRIGGTELKPPSSARADAGVARRWLDAVGSEHLHERLATRTRSELRRDARVSAVVVEEGVPVVLNARSRRTAWVHATRARLSDGRELDGEYFTAGDHWTALREEIGRLKGEGPIAGIARHTRFPEGTRLEVVEAASAASEKLLTQRTLVFAHDICVESDLGLLLLKPLTVPPRPLALPFSLTRHGDSFEGEIEMRSADPLLPCHWRQPTDAETLAISWALALVAYAALTCVAVDAPSTTTTPRRAHTKGSRPGMAETKRRLGGSRTAGSVRVPEAFSPEGDTARILASYVAGHRRRLQPGQSPSDDARRNAAAVGIHLRDRETWVQPHTRGLAPGAVLQFSWLPPAWARS